MITYETYLKHGGKRSENMFVCLRCEYILMRICAGKIARYKDVMRHSGQRDSVETLSSAARDLSYYYNHIAENGFMGYPRDCRAEHEPLAA